MLSHPASLLAAAAGALFLAAAASASICLRQRARRGAWWWAAANALLVVGLGLQALAPADDIAAPLAAVLTLQWPVVALVGLRRFFSRGASALPAWADGVVLAVTTLAAVGTWLAPFDAVRPEQVLAGAALVASLYAAAAVARLEDFATSSTLKTLLLALVAGALAQAAGLGASFAPPPFAATAVQAGLVASLATATMALLMAQLALVMNHERQVVHMRTSQRKLRQLVDVDALTQLPNRRHFHELAERAIKAAPEAATVLVFDVDQLRRINELLGHANGDEALRQVGHALRETLRRRDVAGRLGGDEFAAVLPRTRAVDAGNVVTRINARLGDRQVAPRIARIALNVGITQVLAGEALVDALRRAEIALTVSRDEARRVAIEHAGIAAEAQALRAQAAPRSSQAMPLNAIPVGEVVLGGAAG